MDIHPSTMSVPLQQHSDGTLRVGGTRVLLEVVIRAFHRGETPEGIVESFPTLKLDAVYAVIAYYLQNRAEIDVYIDQVETEGDKIRAQIEEQQPQSTQLRARLLEALAKKHDE